MGGILRGARRPVAEIPGPGRGISRCRIRERYGLPDSRRRRAEDERGRERLGHDRERSQRLLGTGRARGGQADLVESRFPVGMHLVLAGARPSVAEVPQPKPHVTRRSAGEGDRLALDRDGRGEGERDPEIADRELGETVDALLGRRRSGQPGEGRGAEQQGPQDLAGFRRRRGEAWGVMSSYPSRTEPQARR